MNFTNRKVLPILNAPGTFAGKIITNPLVGASYAKLEKPFKHATATDPTITAALVAVEIQDDAQKGAIAQIFLSDRDIDNIAREYNLKDVDAVVKLLKGAETTPIKIYAKNQVYLAKDKQSWQGALRVSFCPIKGIDDNKDLQDTVEALNKRDFSPATTTAETP